VGERLVTFGSMHDQPYVPGVPIGTVTTIERTPGALTRTALVRPFADFTALDVVGVVVGPPKSDPRDAVLPPKPPPTPVAKANAAAARPVKGAAAVKPKRTAPKPKPTKGG
jgi:rod shape-determining protein MreC